MPKRSNLFQEVVASIHRHMAGDAVVEESAMLTHRLTGEPREVDVVVRSTVAGHEVTVGIEATAAGRKATVQWVEQQVAKHQQLDTDKLVLVAQGGFAATARALAERHGAVAISPEDLKGGDPTFDIVNNLNTLWAKIYSATPDGITLRIRHEELGQVVEVVDPPRDLDIMKEDGTLLCPLVDLVMTILDVHVAEHHRTDALRDQAEDVEHTLVVDIDPLQPLINGKMASVFARWMENDGSSTLHEILAMQIRGKSSVSVREISLTHWRLGQVNATYGSFEAEATNTALIATSFAGEERISVRVRDSTGGPVREVLLAPLARGGDAPPISSA